ncbi:hypothetical protein MRB53_006454 [Persea americana]|uniref:Uncharacterized protein n=1 Tax=Persea americana TaxID=3435 RepID=A0ACC2MH52_PERAE|nr:hypothetical protein MRB53_006454 [Persea americana]
MSPSLGATPELPPRPPPRPPFHLLQSPLRLRWHRPPDPRTLLTGQWQGHRHRDRGLATTRLKSRSPQPPILRWHLGSGLQCASAGGDVSRSVCEGDGADNEEGRGMRGGRDQMMGGREEEMIRRIKGMFGKSRYVGAKFHEVVEICSLDEWRRVHDLDGGDLADAQRGECGDLVAGANGDAEDFGGDGKEVGVAVEEGAAEKGGVGALASEPRVGGVELRGREREAAEVRFAGGYGEWGEGPAKAVGRASLSFKCSCVLFLGQLVYSFWHMGSNGESSWTLAWIGLEIGP